MSWSTSLLRMKSPCVVKPLHLCSPKAPRSRKRRRDSCFHNLNGYVSFTDNNSPALLLGTVPIPIIVLPVNDVPVLTSPGNQTSQEGATVALNIVESAVEGDPLCLSTTNLPPGLRINVITPTTAVISGTIANGAATGSPYNVT